MNMKKKVSIMLIAMFLLIVVTFALTLPIYSSGVQPVGERDCDGLFDQYESGGIVDNADILYVPPGETYTLDDVHAYNKFVNISGTLYVTDYDGTGTAGTLELYAPEISISGSVNADGRGWRRNEGPGRGVPCCGGGGGYGGRGGNSGHGGSGGPSYGRASTFEIQRGSGGRDGAGTAYPYGGDGGGSILLVGASVLIEGNVTSDGIKGGNGDWAAGGGSGGGILICASIARISGKLSVRGGNGGSSTYYGGGGGGGGRIKIFYCSLDASGSTIIYSGGSSSGGYYPGQPGQAGTYFTEKRAGIWPMFRHDPTHTGRSPFMGAQQAGLKWRFTTAEIYSSSPAIAPDGTIYVGSNDGKVYAVNPDGTPKWNYTTIRCSLAYNRSIIRCNLCGCNY